MATINHERMPVLLADEADFTTWLDGSPYEAFVLVGEHPSDRMRIVQAGFDKVDRLAS